MHQNLTFAFFTVERPWRPLLGDGPTGQVCLAYSLPGYLVAGGSSTSEAIASLQRLIEASFGTAESPTEWYRSAVKRMSDADKDQFQRMIGDAMLELQPSETSRGGNYFVFPRAGSRGHCAAG